MKNTLFKKILFLFVFVSGQFLIAQTVKGRVTSGGVTIPGVNIFVKGSNIGVSTDFDGTFTLNKVAPGSILVISFIGYNTKEMTADTSAPMEIILYEESKALNEVVVVGYGTSKRKEITGSVSSIKASEFQDQPFTSVDQALIGKAAGVNVTQNNGTPGGGISVQIRGITSINGNEPLYVIDGTPIFADQNNANSGFGSTKGIAGQNTSSALNGINPSDIESIDILKDASATAIYGANGANGVVLITTKKGKKGKSSVNYETFLGLSEVAKFVDVLNLKEYARFRTDFIKIDSEENGNTPFTIPFQYQNPDLLGEGTNWQKEIFRTAVTNNHQLSFSGEKSGTRFYTSLGYLDQEGVLLNSGFKRYSVRLNLDSAVKDWLKLGNNLSIASTLQNNVRNDSRGGAIYVALRQSPELPVRNSDNSYSGPIQGQLGTSTNDATNPVALTELIKNKSQRYKINGNFYADLNVIKNLTFRTEFGYDLNFANLSYYKPRYRIGNTETSNETNEASKQQENSLYWNFKQILTYNKKIENHSFTLLAGHEAQSSSYEFLQGSRNNFPNDEFDVLSLGSVAGQSLSNGKGQWAMESYITRLNYNYGDRYSLTASLRADGSANFGPNNKWGYFPAVSAGWTVSNEGFFKNNIQFINYLKFKGGYGLTGNQNIQSFAFQTLLSVNPSALGGNLYDVTQIGNPNVKWEALKSLNAGVEIGLLRDAVKLEVEYFQKTSSDFLAQEPETAINSGLPKQIINVGEITNKGVDVTLNTKNVNNKNFSWNTTLIFSKYVNKLTSYFDNPLLQFAEVEGGGGVAKPVTITRVGDQVSQFYGYVANGLYKPNDDLTKAPTKDGFSPQYGDVKFADLNNDGLINQLDRTVIGNPFPEFTYTFNNNLKYKNFDLSVVLQGTYGNDVINYTRRYTEGYTDLYSNQSAAVIDRFILGVNEDTDIPRATRKDLYGNNEVSSRFIEDGSYLRIQNLAIGYNFSPDALGQFKFINKFRIYANVQNLYTFTKYSGLDPAIGSYNSNILKTGVDEGRYPISRTYSFGVNLEF
jgi:TonB-dependent starch-binding outer membrane protein SusC